jgi:hypothetical protein
VIIDVVKHHVLFQFQLIFVVMYLMYLLFHVIFLVTIEKYGSFFFWAFIIIILLYHVLQALIPLTVRY